MGRVYLADVFDYEGGAIRENTPVGLHGVGIQLFRVRRRPVPGGSGLETVCTRDVEGH